MLAIRQHGVITLAQLVELGLSASAVRSRVAAGRLHRVHTGVFAVGHAPLTRDGHQMAAVLACGAGAALSHRSAAAKLGLRPTDRSAIDVTSPGRTGRARRGIDSHSGATLAPDDVEEVDGIRCTNVPRTLLDLAEVVGQRQLERACAQAEVLQRFDLHALEDVLARANGRHGAATLRAVLAGHAIAATITRSELEERFLTFLDAAVLPVPDVNTRIEEMEVDFAWRSARLIVELDGFAAHSTRTAFERDRARDRRLQAAGWRVVRVTWRQLYEDPRGLARELEALLGLSRSRLTTP